MSDYSTLNIQQSILPTDDRKYPVKENCMINWTRKELKEYLDMMMRKKGEELDRPILPSSPETFNFS